MESLKTDPKDEQTSQQNVNALNQEWQSYTTTLLCNLENPKHFECIKYYT